MTVPSAALTRIIWPFGDAFKSSKLLISLRAMATKMPTIIKSKSVEMVAILKIRTDQTRNRPCPSDTERARAIAGVLMIIGGRHKRHSTVVIQGRIQAQHC